MTVDVDELRAALAALNVSQAEFARCIGVAGRTVREWACGKVPVPETVRRLIVCMLATPRLLDRMRRAGEDSGEEG